MQNFHLPTDAQEICFKRILKFTLKELLHVSVQSPSSGSVLFELAKVIVIKILKFTLKELLHVSVQSPSSGSVLFELAKVIATKIIS